MLSFFTALSFQQKVLIHSLVVVVVALLLSAGAMFFYTMLHYQDYLRTDAQVHADMIAANSRAALVFDQPEAVEQLLAALDGKASFSQVAVYRQTATGTRPDDAVLFAAYQSDPAQAAWDVLPTPSKLDKEATQVLRPVVLGDDTIGYVRLQFSEEPLQAYVFGLLVFCAVSMCIAMGLALWLSHKLQPLLTRPATLLVNAAKHVIRWQDYSMRAPRVSDDEFGALTDTFNAMLDQIQSHSLQQKATEKEIRHLNESLEKKVQQRTSELESSNVELSQALEALQSTQSQFVEQEKMAALGGLVAGVAHEINTPIGVAMTSASHLDEEAKSFAKQYSKGGLTRRQLEEHVNITKECATILMTNLRRAAELIKSFKAVAVDQSTENCRDFELAQVLDEIITSLRPKLKPQRHQVTIECPTALVMRSYPGALFQVITNLVMNSIIHGFETKTAGEIHISVVQQQNQACLTYCDNGKGMAPNVLDRLFDPFFTTKRHQGGSGLGTHIVYNLVTQALGGTIDCRSEPEGGTTFVLSLPLRLGESTTSLASAS